MGSMHLRKTMMPYKPDMYGIHGQSNSNSTAWHTHTVNYLIFVRRLKTTRSGYLLPYHTSLNWGGNYLWQSLSDMGTALHALLGDLSVFLHQVHIYIMQLHELLDNHELTLLNLCPVISDNITDTIDVMSFGLECQIIMMQPFSGDVQALCLHDDTLQCARLQCMLVFVVEIPTNSTPAEI